MNAPVKIPQLSDALLRANCWRGWMLNQFAHGERQIIEALHRLQPGENQPTILKQRIDRLRPLVPDQSKAVLDDFLRMALDRNALAHGDGLVTIDSREQWLLRLVFHDRNERCVVSHHEPEATILKEQLRAAVCAVRKALTA